MHENISVLDECELKKQEECPSCEAHDFNVYKALYQDISSCPYCECSHESLVQWKELKKEFIEVKNRFKDVEKHWNEVINFFKNEY